MNEAAYSGVISLNAWGGGAANSLPPGNGGPSGEGFGTLPMLDFVFKLLSSEMGFVHFGYAKLNEALH
jgi:hypothetical protein